MDRFARTVLGYHGCAPDFAEALIRGEVAIADWKPSENDYDWLGNGIYFWEYAPERARTWRGKGGVVGAVIQLGRCLDFTDVEHTARLTTAYEDLRLYFGAFGIELPENSGLRRDLDCFVVNWLVKMGQQNEGVVYQTVRGPFLEGEPAFPGSGIHRESHVQLAVRDTACILGVFRPHLRLRGV